MPSSSIEPQFYTADDKLFGTKALVFIDTKILVYRRDGNTDFLPHTLDLPGGRAEANESAFETLAREIKEEFGLLVTKEGIVYAKRYESEMSPVKYAWFVALQLPEADGERIRFGDEGEEWLFMTVEEFLASNESWTLLQERTRTFLDSRQGDQIPKSA